MSHPTLMEDFLAGTRWVRANGIAHLLPKGWDHFVCGRPLMGRSPTRAPRPDHRSCRTCAGWGVNPNTPKRAEGSP